MAYLKATAFVLGVLLIGGPLLWAVIVLPLMMLGPTWGPVVPLCLMVVGLIFIVAGELG